MQKFAKVSESQITSAIVRDFMEGFLKNVETEVVIIGAGPSGLMAAKELAGLGHRVLIVEANNYLGGGFWIGGYLMNGVTVRAPANELLDEMQIPYKKMDTGLYLANGPQACAKLIASACDAGVKVVNMTKFEDVVLREGNRVAGTVLNWTAVAALPRAITCVDPIAIEAKVVIDASGHDAVVANALAKRKLLEVTGFGGMWVEQSEDMLVEKTTQVCPGLIVTGMAVATVFGLPRMGPTFGGMLVSGKQAAQEAAGLLTEEKMDLASLESAVKADMMA